MVAYFLLCERKVSNLIYYYFVIPFIFLGFINNHAEQRKMPRSNPLQLDGCKLLLIFLCVKEKLANLVFYIFVVFSLF